MNELDAERVRDLLNDETDKRLAEAYKASSIRIKNEMSRLYEKYSVDNSLTFNEMSKYNRLTQLNNFIDQEIKDLTGIVNAEIKTLVKEQYQQGYYNYGSVIDGQADAELNWGVLNQDAIRSIISEPTVSGMSLGQILDKNRFMTLLEERRVITQGLVEGDSFQQMARRIAESFDKSYSDAIRIARTEGIRASGEGQTMAYDRAEEEGIELKRIWVASPTGDHPRHYQWGWNGMIADSEGYFHYRGYKTKSQGNWNAPANFNINCRCRIRSEVILPDE